MLTLLLALAASQAPYTPDNMREVEPIPRPRLYRNEGAERMSRLGQSSYAFFEAFPLDGVGTGGVACSTTAPTGVKGEALTFTRASSATCTKGAAGGLATTGIADGDLVSLTNNVARLEYDSTGTLGLLVESARTNSAIYSEEIDNAGWTKAGVGAAAPTVTANYATAPDGTLTADRVQIGACPTGGWYSVAYQIAAKAASVGTASTFCRGTAADQTISVCAFGGAGANTVCTQVTCPAASWSRPIAIGTAANTGIVIGCDNEGFTGGGNTGAADVLIWGAQVEAGAYATSYIPTVAGTATRVAEALNITLPASFSTTNGASWAGTLQHPSGNAGGVWGVTTSLVQDISNRTQLYRANTNVHQCDYFSAAGNRSVGPVITAYVAGQVYRQSCSYSGAGASSTISGYRDGVLTGTSAAGTTGAITVSSIIPVGLTSGTATAGQADGIISRMCADPDPSRCR